MSKTEVNATRGKEVCDRLDELGIWADDEGIGTFELSQEPAKAIALALPDVAIFLHDDGYHAVSFDVGHYRINLTFKPRQIGRMAIIEGTAIHHPPSGG